MTEPAAPLGEPDPDTGLLIRMPWPAPLQVQGSTRAACDSCGGGITVSPTGMRTPITRLCLNCAATRLAERPDTALPGDERLLSATGADTASAAAVVDMLRQAAALHRATLS